MFEIIPFTTWIAFTAASAVLIIIPGPVVTYVIACSMAHGTRTGLMGVIGTSAGTGVLLTACGFGLVPLFVALADWFDVLRLIGAAYLIWLGIQQWRAKPVVMDDGMVAEARKSDGSLLTQGFLIAITNPKSILFFAAFLPQFMSPTAPAGPQLLVLSLTFLVVASVLDGIWAVVGGSVRHLFQTARRIRVRNRISGGLLMLTGVGMAFARRSSDA